jgi:hypothetical protein
VAVLEAIFAGPAVKQLGYPSSLGWEVSPAEALPLISMPDNGASR